MEIFFESFGKSSDNLFSKIVMSPWEVPKLSELKLHAIDSEISWPVSRNVEPCYPLIPT